MNKSFKQKISNNRLKTKYHSTCDVIESIPRLGNFVILAGFYGDLGL